jgi:hypothetical protein
MPKIKKTEETGKGVEGYIDSERNVFVVTGDPHGLLSQAPEPRSVEEIEVSHEEVRNLLKKYKPNF